MGVGNFAIRLRKTYTGIKKMINTSKIYKMRIVFRWLENRSLSGDSAAVLRERIRQSGLHYVPAKGAADVPRVSYGPAAGRGIRAEREYADIYLKDNVPVHELRDALSDPASGLDVLEVTRVPCAFASVQYLASVAKYRIEGDWEAFPPHPRAEDYFNAPQVRITRVSDNGMNVVWDVKPHIVGVETFATQSIRLTLQCIEGKWTNLQELVAAWLGTTPTELSGIQIIREGLYWQDSAGELHLI